MAQGKINHDIQGLYDATKVCNVSFDLSAADPTAVSGSREVLQIARESIGTYRVDLASGSAHGKFICAQASFASVEGPQDHSVSIVPLGDGTAVSQYRVTCERTGSVPVDGNGTTSPRVSLTVWYRATSRSL